VLVDLKYVKGGRGLAAKDASLENSGKQGAKAAPPAVLSERA